MNKTFAFLFLCSFACTAHAQTTPVVQPYGKIDQADLDLKQCDFEKDANAEVLLSTGKLYYGGDLKSMTIEYHKRIKIFNENGSKQADIHLPYFSFNHAEYINGIEAETFNLVDGKVVITKLDKNAIFNKLIDKYNSEISFAMPDIKPGCILDIKYKWNANYNSGIPYWHFQDRIPVRYSELSTSIPDIFYFRPDIRISKSLVTNTTKIDGRVLQVSTHTVSIGQQSTTSDQQTDTYPYNEETIVRGMANVPSLPEEPHMSSFDDNVQRIGFQLVGNKPIGGFNKDISDTWAKVGGELARDDNFGGQLKKSLSNGGEILSQARLLKTDDAKIAYIFNAVKNTMKWNDRDSYRVDDGITHAWETKTGNSAEVNLILYRLLKEAGIDAYPMTVSTRSYGKVSRYNTSTDEFNRTVAYVPVDSTKNYVLDATGKYNLYNETPAELLNSMGLYIDISKKLYYTTYLKKETPARQVTIINAEIKPDGKIGGTAQINSFSYNRISSLKDYKVNGEKKYIDYLTGGDNTLKITSLKMENMDVDTLPLVQNIAFNLETTGSDGTYIYLSPNLFSAFKKNPFLSDTRLTDIDFEYPQNHSINGVYKIPAGYKVDAIPKNTSLVMPDKSISFKRLVAEQDGSVEVHYTINYNKAEYSKDDYPAFHEFFKKMYELLSEQIVLKKS